MKKSKHLIIIGCILTAFILFVVFVYLPYAEKQSETTKMVQSLWPSSQLKDPIREVPNFSFTNYDERKISLSNIKGKVYVVDFFYTSCDAQCPMMATQLTKVQEAFNNSNDFKIVSFSLDPNDSLKELESFAKSYRADKNMWYFLQGDTKKIYQLAEEGFMQIVKDGEGSFQGHTQKFTLVDKNNQIRGFYLGTDSSEIADLINDIQYLMNQ